MNDADIEMLELAEAGDMAAHGVCSLCEDVLDPMDPKWDPAEFPKTRDADGTLRPTTREEYTEMVGPYDRNLHWHISCMKETN